MKHVLVFAAALSDGDVETNSLTKWPGLSLDPWALDFLLVSCDGLVCR